MMTETGRETRDPGFLQLALGDGTPLSALKTAIVVGTILVLINQYDAIVGAPSVDWFKALLTVVVPYCVATWGAICAKRATLDARANV